MEKQLYGFLRGGWDVLCVLCTGMGLASSSILQVELVKVLTRAAHACKQQL